MKKTTKVGAPAAEITPSFRKMAETLFRSAVGQAESVLSRSLKTKPGEARPAVPRKVAILLAHWATRKTSTMGHLQRALDLDASLKGRAESSAALDDLRKFIPSSRLDQMRKSFLESVACGEAVTASNRDLSTRAARVFEAVRNYVKKLEEKAETDESCKLELGFYRFFRYDCQTMVTPACRAKSPATFREQVLIPGGFIEEHLAIQTAVATMAADVSARAKRVVLLFADHMETVEEAGVSSYQQTSDLQEFFRQVCWHRSPELVDS